MNNDTVFLIPSTLYLRLFVLDFNFYKLPKKKLQVGFHVNSEYEFQKHIPYGCGPKTEFITALGVPGLWETYKNFNYKLLNMSSVKEYQQKLPAAKWMKAEKKE
jgi:hypothetical protein